MDQEIFKVFFYDVRCAVVIPELKVRIITYIETITADMLQTVWNELIFRVDVCGITKGAHIVLLNKKIHILLSHVYCV